MPDDYIGRPTRASPVCESPTVPISGYLPVDGEVAEPVREQAVAAFGELGCEVEEVDPGWGDPIAMEHVLFTGTFAGMIGHQVDEWQDVSIRSRGADPSRIALLLRRRLMPGDERP